MDGKQCDIPNTEPLVVEHNVKNSLQYKIVLNPVEKNSSLLKEISVSVINTVEFCSNILSRNGLGIYHDIDRFKSYIDVAAEEIKYLLNSEKDLRKFLCAYPLMFRVMDNRVMVRSWIIFHLNQQEWLKELLPNSIHLLPIYISTIQFYCNELFRITPTFELPIRQLFSHKSKAPEAIQAVTKNIHEFVLLLKMHPEVFVFRGDKVSLSSSAISYRSLQTWVRRLLVGDFSLANCVGKDVADWNTSSEMKLYEVLKNEVVIYEAIGFNYKTVLSNGSIKGMLLHKLFSKKDRMVPMTSTFNKTLVDFELFISSYPEVFTLINKTVFLTQLYLSIIHAELDDQFNCSGSEEDVVDLKNTELSVISFYLRILYKISELPGEITEFPINHLFYYNTIAPPEVKRIAKNAVELKNFLLKYPNIFKINNGDNIIVNEVAISLNSIEKMYTDSVDSTSTENMSAKNLFEEKLTEAVNFYSKIIHELGGTAKIKQLLGYKMQTSEEVQNITTNFQELKKFFCSQQNNFTVFADQVCLVKKLNTEIGVTSPDKLSNKNATENAILFYSDVLKKPENKLISLIRLAGHRGRAPPDVRTVAKNAIELKSFFSQLPEIFTIVDDDKVMLSKTSVITQQQTVPPEVCCKDFHQDAVEFFSKMLSDYGNCRVLSINKLFELKINSSPAIQKIFGSDINNFLSFLKKYPDDFLVTNDNVIGRKRIPKWSYSGKYEDKKFTDPLLLLIFNFFRLYTSNKSLSHIDNLYDNAGRFFLYSDKTCVFPTKSDLLLFLALYPHVFFVDYSRVINIMASTRKAFISAIEKRRFRKHNNASIAKFEKAELSKRTVRKPKQPDNQSLTPLDMETKPFNVGIEENDSQIKTNKTGAVKDITPKQPKNCVELRKRHRRKTQISTKVVTVIEPSISDESLVSELSKNCDEEKEAEFHSSSSTELVDHSLNNQYSSHGKNDHGGGYKPLKIEEIESNIFSNFIGKVNKNCNFQQKNEDISSSHSGKIFLNQSSSLTQSSSFPQEFSERGDFDRLTSETLLFLNSRLWEGDLKIMNIKELFDLFSQSALKIRNYYCKNLAEFRCFLCKFPAHFIINQNNVMAWKNKMLKVSYFVENEEESLPIVLFNFLNLYTKNFNSILLKLLYSRVGKYFCNVNQFPFFKSPAELVLFLEMFPEVFYVDNNYVRNLGALKEKMQTVDSKVKLNSSYPRISSLFDEELYSVILKEKYPYIPESSDSWKDYVLERTHVIESLSQCLVVTEKILNSQRVIALDCEGVSLGPCGRLTLVQIGLVNGEVYIFDIIKEPSMIKDGGLKSVLESESIVKVIHDSKNDVANLYTEYAVTIKQIFDTRVVHHLIVTEGVSPKIARRITAIGFNELCCKYGAPLNVQKDEMKNVYKYNQGYWMDRPLTRDMLAYAALDVASLPKIFYTMLKQVKEKGIPEKTIWELSAKHSLSVLNDNDLLFE